MERGVAGVGDDRLELALDGQEVPVVVDPDAGEERGEQLSLDRSAGGGEQRVGAAHEVQVAQHDAGALLERVRGRVEAGAHLVFLDLKVAEAALECVCSKRSVCGKIDQAFLFDIELLEFLGESCFLFLLAREHVLQGSPYFRLGFLDGVQGEAEEFELPRQGSFNLLDRQVRQIAGTVLSSAAEEIGVRLSGVILCLGKDEAVLASYCVAATAVEHAAREVIVDAVALSPLHAGIENLLHSFEELGRHESFVSAWVDVAFEGHHAQVVRVAQDLTQLASRQRALRPLRRLTCRESLLGEHLSQLDRAVLACRVLLEGPPNERRSLRVDRDGVDESAVEVFAVVDVAELGASGRATTFGLMEELLLDVLRGLADLYFVHDVGDGFHSVGHVALPEVLLGGDELDAHRRENALGEGSIGEVAKRAGTHVDHDVGDLRVLLDVAQHREEHRALADGLCRVARFDELRGDRGASLPCPGDAGFTLRGDGVAIGVNIDSRQHLAGR